MIITNSNETVDVYEMYPQFKVIYADLMKITFKKLCFCQHSNISGIVSDVRRLYAQRKVVI